jgi:hypothetical protein
VPGHWQLHTPSRKSFDVDTKLFSWTDPEKEHLYYDVTQDAKELLGEKSLPKHLFGRVKYWPLVADDLVSVVSA